MDKRIFLAVALLLLLGFVAAAPESPYDVDGEFVDNAIRLSWRHERGQDVSFNIYKGSSIGNAKLFATVEEKYFVDTAVEVGREYVYFITSTDLSGESAAIQSITIKPVGTLNPFDFTVLAPEEKQFFAGEEVYFAVSVQSPVLSELENLVILVTSSELGITRALYFDTGQGYYINTIEMPEVASGETLDLAFTIWANTSFRDQEYSDSQTLNLKIVPAPPRETPNIIKSVSEILGIIWPAIVLVVLIAIVGYFAWAFKDRKLTAEDRVLVEFLDVLRERAEWKHDLLRKKITSEHYSGKESRLQKKQRALEEKLRLREKGITFSANPFAGFDKEEMKEIGILVDEMVPQRRELGRHEMVDWIVDGSHSKKVAKKVAELIFGRKY